VVSGWVFLVPGARPAAVDARVAAWHAQAAGGRVVVRTAADPLGTLVHLDGPDLDDAAASIIRELKGVSAPPPIGSRMRGPEAAPADSSAARGSDLEDASLTVPAGARVRTVRFPDGSILRVTGRTVLGRNPDRAMAAPGVELAGIEDPDRTVSKTHAALELRAGTLWVEDLGSTNGTSVQTADGRRTEALPGHPVAASVGDTVWLGELGLQVDR
jgi:hypothetical protein